MAPNFTLMWLIGAATGIAVLAFVAWRFGGPDALAFAIVTGLFSAILDFLSAFSAQNYVYPGQSRLWVFTYIFFGWIGVCGMCLFLAEGILLRPHQDLLGKSASIWQVSLVAGLIAVLLDLFIDPVAVAGGYWVWTKKGTVYYEIPLLNFVGWFVLMFFAPLGWILVARQRTWGYFKKGLVSLAAIVPLGVGAAVLSWGLNSAVAAMGLQ
jgi:uncharacterized membrane protein